MRIPRYQMIGDHDFFHVTWRCHSRHPLLQDDVVKQKFYDLLLKYKDRYEVTIYNYAFMSNHIHLVGRLKGKESFSTFFKVVNSLIARFINRRNPYRDGQVVKDRFHSKCIQSEGYLWNAIRYLDLNPCRADMVSHPREHRFTSYHYYAYGKTDKLVTPFPGYLEMGKTAILRQKHYRRAIEAVIKTPKSIPEWDERAHFIGGKRWMSNRETALSGYVKDYVSDWKDRHRHWLKKKEPS